MVTYLASEYTIQNKGCHWMFLAGLSLRQERKGRNHGKWEKVKRISRGWGNKNDKFVISSDKIPLTIVRDTT